jgi:membrane dipeptidase
LRSLTGAAAYFALPALTSKVHAEPTPPLTHYSQRARRLMEESDVLDMLCAVTRQQNIPGESNALDAIMARRTAWLKDPQSLEESEMQIYRDSSITTFYIGTDPMHAYYRLQPREASDRFFRLWMRLLVDRSDVFFGVFEAGDLDRVKNSGKIGIILGSQNGRHFESVDDVDYFYGLGQRVSQLSYNSRTHLASGAFTEDTGITQFGAQVVKRMNRVGMALDLSHASDQTIYDGIALCDGPALITHSNCRALVAGHKRAVTDMAIRALANKGGVMGLTFLRNFVSNEEPTTVEQLVDHVDHVANLVGIEHVGIGTDITLAPTDVDPEAFKAWTKNADPEFKFRDRVSLDGMDHPRKIYHLVEAMIDRGYSDSDIQAVLGGNFKRVLKAIWLDRA